MANLTDGQAVILDQLRGHGVQERRTDRIAKRLIGRNQLNGKPWLNQDVSCVGLQLRELGYVTTVKDCDTYAIWNLTANGLAAIVQHRAEEKRRVQAAQAEHEAKQRHDKGAEFYVFDLEAKDYEGPFDTFNLAKKEAEETLVAWPNAKLTIVQTFTLAEVKLQPTVVMK